MAVLQALERSSASPCALPLLSDEGRGLLRFPDRESERLALARELRLGAGPQLEIPHLQFESARDRRHVPREQLWLADGWTEFCRAHKLALRVRES